MSSHPTPRMGNRPHDPAYEMLHDAVQSTPRVHRIGCYICADMEYARMGLPLCSPCHQCRLVGQDGHIPADGEACDDCGHTACSQCFIEPAVVNICTCDTPCCEVDVMVGVITCGSRHCPTHGYEETIDGVAGQV